MPKVKELQIVQQRQVDAERRLKAAESAAKRWKAAEDAAWEALRGMWRPRIDAAWEAVEGIWEDDRKDPVEWQRKVRRDRPLPQ